MSQGFPEIHGDDRLKVKIAAIALAEAEGWELIETAFDWLMWPAEKLAESRWRINPRSIDFVRRANAVVQAISDL